MSTFEVKIHQLVIHEHPNADALELAQVGGYRAVVQKGVYNTGDWALYIPEKAILPADLIEELGLTGRLGGSAKNRVSAVKLRGQLSQGIVCWPQDIYHVRAAIEEAVTPASAWADGDFAATLGITKYTPPVPAHLSGAVEPGDGFVPMYDIDDIKKNMTLFDGVKQVEATEKVHGTNFGATFTGGRFMVSSKGLGNRGLTLTKAEGNTYWRAAAEHDVEKFCRWLAGSHLAQDERGYKTVAAFGEVYGYGVQDLHYGHSQGASPSLFLFDVYLEEFDGWSKWLSPGSVRQLITQFTNYMAGESCWLKGPELLYEGPYDYEALCAVANRTTYLGGGAHVMEGLVVKAAWDQDLYDAAGNRRVAKFINPDYLLRGGGATEFE